MKTIEEGFAEINRRGLLVHNLFQITPDHWRCSTRRGMEEVYFSGDGKTPMQAIDDALRGAPNPPRAQSSRVEKPKQLEIEEAIQAEPDPEDLI